MVAPLDISLCTAACVVWSKESQVSQVQRSLVISIIAAQAQERFKGTGLLYSLELEVARDCVSKAGQAWLQDYDGDYKSTPTLDKLLQQNAFLEKKSDMVVLKPRQLLLGAQRALKQSPGSFKKHDISNLLLPNNRVLRPGTETLAAETFEQITHPSSPELLESVETGILLLDEYEQEAAHAAAEQQMAAKAAEQEVTSRKEADVAMEAAEAHWPALPIAAKANGKSAAPQSTFASRLGAAQKVATVSGGGPGSGNAANSGVAGKAAGADAGALAVTGIRARLQVGFGDDDYLWVPLLESVKDKVAEMDCCKPDEVRELLALSVATCTVFAPNNGLNMFRMIVGLAIINCPDEIARVNKGRFRCVRKFIEKLTYWATRRLSESEVVKNDLKDAVKVLDGTDPFWFIGPPHPLIQDEFMILRLKQMAAVAVRTANCQPRAFPSMPYPPDISHFNPDIQHNQSKQTMAVVLRLLQPPTREAFALACLDVLIRFTANMPNVAEVDALQKHAIAVANTKSSCKQWPTKLLAHPAAAAVQSARKEQQAAIAAGAVSDMLEQYKISEAPPMPAATAEPDMQMGSSVRAAYTHTETAYANGSYGHDDSFGAGYGPVGSTAAPAVQQGGAGVGTFVQASMPAMPLPQGGTTAVSHTAQYQSTAAATTAAAARPAVSGSGAKATPRGQNATMMPDPNTLPASTVSTTATAAIASSGAQTSSSGVRETSPYSEMSIAERHKALLAMAGLGDTTDEDDDEDDLPNFAAMQLPNTGNASQQRLPISSTATPRALPQFGTAYVPDVSALSPAGAANSGSGDAGRESSSGTHRLLQLFSDGQQKAVAAAAAAASTTFTSVPAPPPPTSAAAPGPQQNKRAVIQNLGLSSTQDMFSSAFSPTRQSSTTYHGTATTSSIFSVAVGDNIGAAGGGVSGPGGAPGPHSRRTSATGTDVAGTPARRVSDNVAAQVLEAPALFSTPPKVSSAAPGFPTGSVTRATPGGGGGLFGSVQFHGAFSQHQHSMPTTGYATAEHRADGSAAKSTYYSLGSVGSDSNLSQSSAATSAVLSGQPHHAQQPTAHGPRFGEPRSGLGVGAAVASAASSAFGTPQQQQVEMFLQARISNPGSGFGGVFGAGPFESSKFGLGSSNLGSKPPSFGAPDVGPSSASSFNRQAPEGAAAAAAAAVAASSGEAGAPGNQGPVQAQTVKVAPVIPTILNAGPSGHQSLNATMLPPPPPPPPHKHSHPSSRNSSQGQLQVPSGAPQAVRPVTVQNVQQTAPGQQPPPYGYGYGMGPTAGQQHQQQYGPYYPPPPGMPYGGMPPPGMQQPSVYSHAPAMQQPMHGYGHQPGFGSHMGMGPAGFVQGAFGGYAPYPGIPGGSGGYGQYGYGPSYPQPYQPPFQPQVPPQAPGPARGSGTSLQGSTGQQPPVKSATVTVQPVTVHTPAPPSPSSGGPTVMTPTIIQPSTSSSQLSHQESGSVQLTPRPPSQHAAVNAAVPVQVLSSVVQVAPAQPAGTYSLFGSTQQQQQQATQVTVAAAAPGGGRGGQVEETIDELMSILL